MIVVTGATGQLGRLVIEGLRAKVPADQIVAAVRTPEKAADLGVQVREADYGKPATLAAAFAGADQVLLISSSEVGQRIPQHTAVVEAAQQAGVKHLIYTSAPKADDTALVLAPDHAATERIIRASGLPFTFLRNGWYTENYAQKVQDGVARGSFAGSAGQGAVATATRADYAAAAVAVLTSDGHDGRVYELSGDHAWTYADLAETIAQAAGKAVTYEDLTPDAHRTALAAAGLPEPVVELVVGLDRNTADGLLGQTSGELRALIGRPTTPYQDTVAQMVKSLG
ncbi:SDR family oxidoreductase [Fodinicola feengrottensis]|uniref:SDR family oxidoreductase n=1 Tax=Fodinicola feengrottensis TaxID=435914 RepID=A0ABN2I155_9ACTN|nr:SDR family oxidoreductase [Fodinicola feengrottensis]